VDKKLSFSEVLYFARQGARIGPCAEIEIDGKFVGYPEDYVGPEYSGSLCPMKGHYRAREVLELDPDGYPTGFGVWLPMEE
jgi:hypothetical protein